MSRKNYFLALRSRKQHSLPNAFPPQRASLSLWTRHLRICSSKSLPPYISPSPSDFDDIDPLDSLSQLTLDSDLDQCTASSTTLLSRRVSPSLSTNQPFIDASHVSSEHDLFSRQSESRSSCFRYPLREPGQMTAHRIQRLRTRTAAVITSIPATHEDACNTDEYDPPEILEGSSVAQRSKLRHIAGVRDLRSAFRDSDPEPEAFASGISHGLSKTSYELGILGAPTPPLSQLSPRSSLRTLVGLERPRHQSSGDLKTLCRSTFSSATISSRFPAKVHSTSASWSSRTCLPPDIPRPITPRKPPAHSLSKTQLHRYASLHQNIHLSRSLGDAGDVVWSCAKISQSAVKRAARRGHAPRRVFSNPNYPIAALSPQRLISPSVL